MDTLLEFLPPALAAVAVFCLALGGAELFSTLKVEAKREEKQLPLFIRLALPFTPNLLFLVDTPALEREREKTKESLTMAGFDEAVSPSRFLAARLLLLVMGLGLFALCFGSGQAVMGLLWLLLLYAWPVLWLRKAIRVRHEQIQRALPNVLDLLTLSVEAGKDFVTALRDILARRGRDALTEELETAFREIQLGKQRRLALKDMAARVKQHDLTQVVNAIAQADELGVSIGHLLRIQSDQFRTKRFQRAEKLANEAPVKILFPVVVFIFPSVFVILLAPILLQAFKTLFR